MFAKIAAVLFGLALLIDLLNLGTNQIFNVATLTTAGLLFVALHLGFGWTGGGGWYRGRRPGRG
jgi:hypothetical protein